MGRRSRKQKKLFSCGHRGFGKFCHRCVTSPKVTPAARANGPVFAKSKIIKIVVCPCKDVFGEGAFSPNRLAAVVYTENGARLPLMVPLGARYESGTNQWIIFDKKQYNRSVSWRRSKAGAFLKKYGSLPVVGLEVETCTNEKGYLTIYV